MSNTTTKVLAGCGVGCLLFGIAMAGIGWMGYRWAKTAAEVIEAAEIAERELEAQYGSVREFTPTDDGRISGARMEVFLSIREAMAPQRTALAEGVMSLAPNDGEGRAVDGLRAARAGMSLAPRILDFAKTRNEALLEAGMGPGEYAWTYWLTYHGWLGHPMDESLLQGIMEARTDSEGTVQMHFDGMDSERLTWQLRGHVTAMLYNLDDALKTDPGNELAGLVALELETIAADPGRFPWEDGLPEQILTGLDSFRDRLEENYSPATNPFELLELD